MCSATHAYAGLGRIVYVSSSVQLTAWMKELSEQPGPVQSLAINDVAPGTKVEGPVEGLDDEVKELHRLRVSRSGST